MRSSKQLALLAAPPLVLASMWLAFTRLGQRFGPKGGYLLGFLIYWVGWCFLFPLWILGRRGVVESFRRPHAPGARLTSGPLAGLVAPPALGFATAFPRQLPKANLEVVVQSLAIATVNATGEELLWRACYLRNFADQPVAGYLYPTLGFALWHYAPQTLFPNTYPGGATSLVAVSGLVGLLYGWLARRTGSIRWTTISHLLFDFSGLGALIYRR